MGCGYSKRRREGRSERERVSGQEECIHHTEQFKKSVRISNIQLYHNILIACFSYLSCIA